MIGVESTRRCSGSCGHHRICRCVSADVACARPLVRACSGRIVLLARAAGGGSSLSFAVRGCTGGCRGKRCDWLHGCCWRGCGCGGARLLVHRCLSPGLGACARDRAHRRGDEQSARQSTGAHDGREEEQARRGEASGARLLCSAQALEQIAPLWSSRRAPPQRSLLVGRGPTLLLHARKGDAAAEARGGGQSRAPRAPQAVCDRKAEQDQSRRRLSSTRTQALSSVQHRRRRVTD